MDKNLVQWNIDKVVIRKLCKNIDKFVCQGVCKFVFEK